MANYTKTESHKDALRKSIRHFHETGMKVDPTVTTLRKIWNAMKHRCTWENDPNYYRYGGRGIKVCDRWLESFDNFLEDMRPSYEKGLWLDRLDNNKGYSPQNCAWTTPKEQAINRRNTRLLSYNGKSMTITDWARELGIKRSTLSMRYYKYGWPLDRLLNGC